MWDESDSGFLALVLVTMIFIGILYAGESILTRDDDLSSEIMANVVTIAREQYDTENIALLKKLEENETHLKYELLVEGEIKQAVYVKDTSEVAVIE